MNPSTDEQLIANESGKTRLILVDDHDLIRSGLRRMLERQPELEVVGEAKNGREAVELCRRLRPALVLMDVRMPEMDGIAATRVIKQELPRTGVLMVTSFEDPDYLYEALKAGAAGYILKDATHQELISTVHKVISGEFPLNAQLASQLLMRLASEAREKPVRDKVPVQPAKRETLPSIDPLSSREVELLQLLVRGQTNREIAKNLLVSVSTVKHHIQRILTKLDVSDRTQAAVRTLELGLLPRDQ